MQSSGQGSRYPCDIHDIGRPPSELPFSVKVEDRGIQQTDIKFGDILTIYAIGDTSGFITQHEKTGTFLFIPGSYDGTFTRSSALFPQAEDLRKSDITQHIKATKSWVSPYSNLDSLFLDDVMRVIRHDYVNAIPHDGPEEEMEVLICELKTHSKDKEQKLVMIPLCAEGNFELMEERRNIQAFKITELLNTCNPTEYVEVQSRGSSAYVCQNEALIKSGRKMVIELEVSASAVLVWNERSNKLIEILNTDMLIVNLVSHNDRTDVPVDCTMGVGRTVHILSEEKADTLKGFHPYSDISDDLLLMRKFSERKHQPLPERPPIKANIYDEIGNKSGKVIPTPPLKGPHMETAAAKKKTSSLPNPKRKADKLKLFSLFK